MAEHADELTGLRELASRLLAMPGPFVVPESPPQFVVGRLPDGLPLDPPLPPGTRIVGSVRRERPPVPGASVPSGEFTEIVADVPSTAEDVLHFYEREMPACGWPLRENDSAPRPGGFSPMHVRPGRGFSQTPDGPVVSITAAEAADGNSDVRIHISPLPSRPNLAPPMRPPGFGILPTLTPPLAVPLHPLGGGGGPTAMSSTAVALTDQSSETLAAHFAQQFQAAGWTRTDGGTNGPMTWSTWTSAAHEGWAGLLLIVEEPTPNQRLLHARVSLAEAAWPQAQAGWVGTMAPFTRF